MARPQVKSIEQVELEEKENKVDKRTEDKELSVYRVPSGLYSVRYSSGGEVPDSLKTLFTSANKAQEAIVRHEYAKVGT